MIVVTGATGNVGTPLVQALVAAGEKVTTVSRRPSETPGHRQADLAEPASLKPALDGAEALFLLVGSQLLTGAADPGAILDTAKAAGVRKVVLLSSQGAGTRPHAPSHGELRRFESALRSSGLAWTILRPGGFDSNALMWAESVRTRRTIVAPFGDVGLPLIDPADIAEVAAAVLREPGHEARVYVLTGPAPVSPRRQAAAIGAAIGSEVRFLEQSREEARAQLVQFMPEPVADGTLDILGRPTAEERQVSPDVERVLGRTGRTFAEWAARTGAAFR
ncbi:SDR family oxidoreductase [Amycolatopsis alkalitolerans]|uniref:NAD-dependent epimerase/dehydratase family protein n=1 Tax=Amycolatopsis alkalitolerans TaxID=2547244 RepID=A0A5C4M986_9PSEU|nr:NAD(P)H-binding protein [Amycolatopsis alkalitolerans]TNC28469.1 NAD-dependent epimerase/dehydratase family protein [Amycolatopsis alkalitolerans]